MAPSQRRWTDEEKADILDRAKEIGIRSAAEEAGVSEASIYAWKKAFSS